MNHVGHSPYYSHESLLFALSAVRYPTLVVPHRDILVKLNCSAEKCPIKHSVLGIFFIAHTCIRLASSPSSRCYTAIINALLFYC